MKTQTLIFLLLVLAVAISQFAFVRTHRINQSLMRALESGGQTRALAPGDLVPGFTAVNLEGMEEQVQFIGSNRYHLLQFIAIDCAGCMAQVRGFWPQLTSDPRLDFAAKITVSLSDVSGTAIKFTPDLQVGQVVITEDPAVKQAYVIQFTPLLVLVSPEGKVTYLHRELLNPSNYESMVKTMTSLYQNANAQGT